ncbi:hypothetical protein J6590_091137 [Homalodisca vitripennis]|nr:hypothetical protein J6590_091137 [Homalodisca vitripennis]
MTRSYIDSRLARRLRHGRKKQTGLVLGRSVFSIARRVRLPGRPAGASVGGYTARLVFVYFRREPTEPTVKSGEKTGPGDCISRNRLFQLTNRLIRKGIGWRVMWQYTTLCGKRVARPSGRLYHRNRLFQSTNRLIRKVNEQTDKERYWLESNVAFVALPPCVVNVWLNRQGDFISRNRLFQSTNRLIRKDRQGDRISRNRLFQLTNRLIRKGIGWRVMWQYTTLCGKRVARPCGRPYQS